AGPTCSGRIAEKRGSSAFSSRGLVVVIVGFQAGRLPNVACREREIKHAGMLGLPQFPDRHV
ncbi:MAG: hypothetical protein ABIR10_01285, partial [Dokdonella sp.]